MHVHAFNCRVIFFFFIPTYFIFFFCTYKHAFFRAYFFNFSGANVIVVAFETVETAEFRNFLSKNLIGYIFVDEAQALYLESSHRPATKTVISQLGLSNVSMSLLTGSTPQVIRETVGEAGGFMPNYVIYGKDHKVIEKTCVF